MDEAKEVLETKAEEKEPFLKPQTLRRFVAFLLDFMLLIVFLVYTLLLCSRLRIAPLPIKKNIMNLK